jgi:hypothetical protein
MKKALIPILLFVLGTGYVFFFAPENSTPQERETAQLGGLLEDTARRTLFSQTFTDGTNTIRQFHQAPIFYETQRDLNRSRLSLRTRAPRLSHSGMVRRLQSKRQ